MLITMMGKVIMATIMAAMTTSTVMEFNVKINFLNFKKILFPLKYFMHMLFLIVRN